MSRFATQFELTAWEILADQHGVSSSTFTPGDGSAATTGLTVILDVMASERDEIDDMAVQNEFLGTVHVLNSDLDLTAANTGGRFTISSVDWEFDRRSPPVLEGSVWRCEVRRVELRRVPPHTKG